MWLLFALLLVLWVLCIHYYVPFLITLATMAAMLTVAGVALMPSEALFGEQEEN